MKKVPYASTVGSLMYAMAYTRPDIAHAVRVVSRFLSNPGKEHWHTVKWIFKYLRGTFKFIYALVIINLYYVDIQMQIWMVILTIQSQPLAT